MLSLFFSFCFWLYDACLDTCVGQNKSPVTYTTIIFIMTPKTGDQVTRQVAESLGSWAKSDPPHSWLMTELWMRLLDRDLGLSSQVR